MTLLSPNQLARHQAIGQLGPEPLDATFDPAALARAMRGRKTTLKAALLDQRVVAGLGNIYVSEALHRARLSPRRRASTIATTTGAPRDAARRLVEAIKIVLNDALAWGARSRAGKTGELGYFEYRFRVYDREGERCLRRGCGGTIRRIVQGGRSTFFCPKCQR
jgi:formamidopyrimidine-DNA glycosylase